MNKITNQFLKNVCTVDPSPWDDQRYMVRSPSSEELTEIPKNYDGLKSYFKRRYYQGNIGSCVGHSVSIALEVTNYLLDNKDDNLSAWDCYIKARKYGNTPDWKTGANVLGAMKGLHKVGICTERCWPTITNKSVSPRRPCVNREAEALNYRIDSYWQIPLTTGAFKAAIWGTTHRAVYDMPDGSQGKIPLIVVYKIHDSFKEDNNGVVPSVQPGDKMVGRHASVVRGWRIIDGKLHWINQNSWGRNCGDGGIFYLPEGFAIYEAWLIHNGPQTGDVPSSCIYGNSVAKTLNLVPSLLGRRGRFRYLNP